VAEAVEEDELDVLETLAIEFDDPLLSYPEPLDMDDDPLLLYPEPLDMLYDDPELSYPEPLDME